MDDGYANTARVNFGGTSTGVAPAQRPATELEALCGNLGDTLRRLTILNDKVGARVENFMPTPQPISTGGKLAEAEQPAPPLGTLGCLRHLQQRLDNETARLDGIHDRLAGIL